MTGQRVAVVGAGAAGLVTARELTRLGHAVSVFEQTAEIGGVWVYTPATDEDPLGQRGRRVHGSLYPSLRTNLPRDLMAFLDYPFDGRGGGDDEWPRFPGHAHVLTYLRNFARHFDLRGCIRFDTRVASIERGDGWFVTTHRGDIRQRERFDAVAVCNGHYARPRVPELPGIRHFPGEVLHSHNYRHAEPFAGRRVAVLGASASGVDLSREIAAVAARVYWCADGFAGLEAGARCRDNLERRAAIASIGADGTLGLRDGSRTPPIDALVLCTGYRYHYPFLTEDLITVEDNWVQPLWRDLLHVEHPTLAFIGIPFRVVPFPLFEVQARWFAHLLRGEVALPGAARRRAERERREAELRAAGVRQRHFHQRSLDCYDYLDPFSDECGQARIPAWHRQLAAALMRHVASHPNDYREQPLPGREALTGART